MCSRERGREGGGKGEVGNYTDNEIRGDCESFWRELLCKCSPSDHHHKQMCKGEGGWPVGVKGLEA